MEENVLISIIIPVYNAEKTLRQCLDSVIALEYKYFEVLLIDDGSQDSSFKICEEYVSKDDRFKVFKKENGGVSSARNMGLRMCSSTWVTFVDSDDMVSKDYLSGVVESAEDMVMVGYWNISPDGTKFWSRHIPEKVSKPSISLFIEEMMGSFELRGPVCKFYRRALLDGILFPEDMTVGEDSFFVMEYLKRVESLIILPHSYYIHRCHVHNAAKRYKVTVENAVNSLCHLKKAYHGLVVRHGIKKEGFMNFIGFFKAASIDDWKSQKSKWYNNREIIGFYKYIWPDISFKQKLYIIGAFVLRK